MHVTWHEREQKQDIDCNTYLVVPWLTALVHIESMAHYLISLDAQVIINHNQQSNTLQEPYQLLKDYNPVTKAEIGKIMQVCNHKEFIPKPSFWLWKQPNTK